MIINHADYSNDTNNVRVYQPKPPEESAKAGSFLFIA